MKAIDVIRIISKEEFITVIVEKFGMKFETRRSCGLLVENYEKSGDEGIREFLNKEVKSIYTREDGLAINLK